MPFEVVLDEPRSPEVTVSYGTVEETASAMLDFLPASGVLVFPPGVVAMTPPVVLRGSTLPVVISVDLTRSRGVDLPITV